ncbi:MAG: ABC transporter permease [Burkholderiales bacterium]|nr:ABC transporter permease [Burkholderiales bacterium]
MKPVQLSWNLLRRDWRAGELQLLAAALVVAVAAIASVGFFVDRIKSALNLQARQLLGGDLVIVSTLPLSPEVFKQAGAQGLSVVRTLNFPSMALVEAKPGSEQPPAALLASLKAVSEGYPLRGAVRVSTSVTGPDAPATGVPSRGSVWVDPPLMQGLGLEPGGSLMLGDKTFRIERLIIVEPDRGSTFVNFAPRAMIALDDLEATQLVQPASRVTYRTMLAGDARKVADFEAWVTPRLAAGQRIETLENGRPEMRSTIDRAQQFLALVSLLAALIAAVAIAVAARRFAQRHLDGCAVMRAIGITQGRLLTALMLEMVWLGLAAGIVGAVLGWAGHLALTQVAAPMINLELPAASFVPAVQAVCAGLLLLLGFAAVPLMRLAGVPPLRVLRRDLGAPPIAAWVAALTALLAFSALLLWVSGDRKLAGIAIGGFAAGGVIFVGVAWLAIRLIAPLRHLVGTSGGNAALRMALASWSRRQGASIAQTAALSVGMMALLLLTVTRGDLLDSWQRATPPDAPNRFIINIQPDQREPVAQALREAGILQADLLPMIRARLTAINGKTVDPARFEDERARRLVDREFNLSYMSAMQPHNRNMVGRWLDPARPEASMEVGIMKTLGLSLGDTLSFEIAGESVEVTAVGARKVAWDSMQVNFFMILSPAALGDRPQTWISSFRLPDEKSAIVNRLLARFPNLTVYDTGLIVRQVQSILDHVIRAVQFLFVFTLAAGVVVLYAALASSRDERVREAALMRALGASRRQLQRAQLFELAATGALAGFLAALGAIAIGAVLAHQVFDFEFAARWGSVPLAMLAGAALSTIAGWFSLKSVVDSPPLATLRNI